MDNQVIEAWEHIKAIVEAIDLDVLRNAKGNNAAGVRIRKGLRLLKSNSAKLIRETVDVDKTRKGSKRRFKKR
jgi:hypothetical protein